MSKVISIYKCHEIIVDANNDFVSEHFADLPHSEFIQEEFCKQFNEAAERYLLDIMNKECDDKIQRLIAKPMTIKLPDHKTAVGIHIYGCSVCRWLGRKLLWTDQYIDRARWDKIVYRLIRRKQESRSENFFGLFFYDFSYLSYLN